MLLNEAKQRLDSLVNIPFSELFNAGQLETIILNKGKTGQLLEMALGMQLTNKGIDFEDGELKTNKCDINAKPRETIFIMQISSIIDELLECKSFEETHLYEKISNLLYVPVCKDGLPKEWLFLPCIQVDLNKPMYGNLKATLDNDYYSICHQLKQHIETSADGYIHTSNGELMQIRSKDSKPYFPIKSKVYNKNVSNKNHAFYFKKEVTIQNPLINQSFEYKNLA